LTIYAWERVTVIHELAGRVKRYPDNTAVKSGHWAHQDECAALCFVAELDLPAPHVVETQGESETIQEDSIRMTFIEGQELDHVWQGLSADENLSIYQHLIS
jgi:hypothetical protein